MLLSRAESAANGRGESREEGTRCCTPVDTIDQNAVLPRVKVFPTFHLYYSITYLGESDVLHVIYVHLRVRITTVYRPVHDRFVWTISTSLRYWTCGVYICYFRPSILTIIGGTGSVTHLSLVSVCLDTYFACTFSRGTVTLSG
jgi:hypothetical protein